MRSRFEETHRSLIVAVAKGLTFGEACRRCGVPVATARGWLKCGKAEESGPYREFVRAIDEARKPLAKGDGPVSEAELSELAWAAARGGSVSAMRLVREMLRERRGQVRDDTLSEVDEIAARRMAAQRSAS